MARVFSLTERYMLLLWLNFTTLFQENRYNHVLIGELLIVCRAPIHFSLI
jgi:hypothetical protein